MYWKFIFRLNNKGMIQSSSTKPQTCWDSLKAELILYVSLGSRECSYTFLYA